jgi:hypothetical protein
MGATCSQWQPTPFGSGRGFARLLAAAAAGGSPSLTQLAAHNGARPVAGPLFPDMIGQLDPWLWSPGARDKQCSFVAPAPHAILPPNKRATLIYLHMLGLHIIAARSP